MLIYVLLFWIASYIHTSIILLGDMLEIRDALPEEIPVMRWAYCGFNRSPVMQAFFFVFGSVGFGFALAPLLALIFLNTGFRRAMQLATTGTILARAAARDIVTWEQARDLYSGPDPAWTMIQGETLASEERLKQ